MPVNINKLAERGFNPEKVAADSRQFLDEQPCVGIFIGVSDTPIQVRAI